jgi:hypothetical protein
MKKKWFLMGLVLLLCFSVGSMKPASFERINWEQHFRNWLETEFIPDIEALFETRNLPALLKASHPRKLSITATTPAGEILDSIGEMHNLFRGYDGETHTIQVEIKSIYVREVANMKPGEDDPFHIGHAVIEYRLVSKLHNNTGSLALTVVHPRKCEWGK